MRPTPCLFLALTAGLLPMTAADASEPPRHHYADALQKSLFFYDVQRSGKLPTNFRVAWRGDSCLKDGQDIGRDLSGGWYDAGDHVKTNVSIGYATAMLAWGLIDAPEAYRANGQVPVLLDSLRHSCDFLLNGFTDDRPGHYEFVTQIGKTEGVRNDHSEWAAAEVIDRITDRPTYRVTAQVPGMDVTGHAAAGLAAASVAFRNFAPDAAYADKLLGQARKLFHFADDCRGEPGRHVRADGVAEGGGLYRDGKLVGLDRLAWAACWLHMAEKAADARGYDGRHLQRALAVVSKTDYAGQYGGKHWAEFGMLRVDKGVSLLLARFTGQPWHGEEVEQYLDWWTIGVGDKVKVTPGGLAWRQDWGVLRYAVNTSWFALVWSDHLARLPDDPKRREKIDRYRAFAARQIGYVLGDNPTKRSYLIGYGPNSWDVAHHRTAYGPWAGWEHLTPGKPEYRRTMRHTLHGGLLGGPDENDRFTPDIKDAKQCEVALDYQAALPGTLARLGRDQGGRPTEPFPPPEVPADEFFVAAKVTKREPGVLELTCEVNNRSAWPARALSDVSFRYSGDVPDGAKWNDFRASAGPGAKVEVRPIGERGFEVVVVLPGRELIPGGLDPAKNWQPRYAATVTLALRGPTAWRPERDPSGGWIGGADAGESAPRSGLTFFERGEPISPARR